MEQIQLKLACAKNTRRPIDPKIEQKTKYKKKKAEWGTAVSLSF